MRRRKKKAAPTPAEAAAPAAPAPAEAPPAPTAESRRAARRALLEEKRKAHAKEASLSYTEFWDLLCKKRYAKLVFAPDCESVLATQKAKEGAPLPQPQRVQLPFDEHLVPKVGELLKAKELDVEYLPPSAFAQFWAGWGRFSSPIIGIWGLYMLFKQSTEEPADDFMSPKAKKAQRNTGFTLKDVAGLGEAKAEAEELVRYMKNSDMYLGLGAQLPAGVLLVGPPGAFD